MVVLALMATIAVHSPGELAAALQRARGGDTIVLAGGDYGAQRVIGKTFDAPVTIRSADPQRPASIAALTLINARNLVFIDVEFTRNLGNEQRYSKIVSINGGGDIGFRGGSVHGSLDGDPSNDMNGIFAQQVDNLKVTGVTFKQLSVALVMEDGKNLWVENSAFSELGADAIDIPGTAGVNIVKNHFFDYRPNVGAHPDGVQCWTRNKNVACTNIVIRENLFESTPGREFQGVFFGDEAKLRAYDNIEISDNIFKNTMWHAINIGAGANIVIKNNVVIAGPNAKPWIRTEGPAVLSGNSAPTYVIGGVARPPRGNRTGGLYKKP